ncbi:MAG: RNA methyltransferase [Dysgonamonadaceae bacterium]|jgi:TrmH family RNA methyltransferase|nr:RNA methyltransferase [Dysgonamonadaceae bacterium]
MKEGKSDGIITSLHNNRVKNIVRLIEKSKERRLQALFAVEGAREISLALAGGYIIDSIFVCNTLFESTNYPEVMNGIDSGILFEVSESVFSKIAYRETSDGLIALVKPKPHRLTDLKLTENPFIIVIEAVEKPGNLGAILRTADAAAVDALIICDPLTDVYNPNVIRSSVGCIFTVPVAVSTGIETFDFLKDNNIQIFAAGLDESCNHYCTDFKKPSAIVMGTESDGLSRFWLDHADRQIKIPMHGKIDSLNVSVSTAVITYEAMRQRGL